MTTVARILILRDGLLHALILSKLKATVFTWKAPQSVLDTIFPDVYAESEAVFPTDHKSVQTTKQAEIYLAFNYWV